MFLTLFEGSELAGVPFMYYPLSHVYERFYHDLVILSEKLIKLF